MPTTSETSATALDHGPAPAAGTAVLSPVATRDASKVRHDAERMATPLLVQAWSDPVVDAVGHDLRSAYVERYWLPILGPSTILLLRRLADSLDAEPDGFRLDLTATAGSLGIGHRTGKQAPMLRAVDRCCVFGVARQLGTHHLAVRRRMAPLSTRQVQRLPEALRAEHDASDERSALSASGSSAPTPLSAQEQKQRAHALALSLLQLGETPHDTERQLHRWRFHPALTHEALRWALARMADDEASGASVSEAG